jgi:hypothetical protein
VPTFPILARSADDQELWAERHLPSASSIPIRGVIEPCHDAP